MDEDVGGTNIKYRTCRTCLKSQEKLMPLLNLVNAAQKTYGQLLAEYAQLEFSNEHETKMPQGLCTKCCRQLTRTYKFISQAQESNNKLMKMVTSIKVDCLREESIDLPIEESDMLEMKNEYNLEDVNPFKGASDLREQSLNNNKRKKIITDNERNKEDELLNQMGDTSLKSDTDEIDHLEPPEQNFVSLSGDAIPTKPQVSCPVCFKPLKKAYLLKHLRKMHEIATPSIYLEMQQKPKNATKEENSAKKTFKCELCDYMAKSKAGMNYHKRTKHTTENDKFKCKFCAFNCLKKLDLVVHIKDEHKSHIKALIRNVDRNITNDSEDSDYISNGNAKANFALNQGSDDDEEFIREMIKEDRKILKFNYVDGKPYNSLARKCDQCDKVYKDFPSLYAHKRFVHMSEDMYSVCLHCGKKYKRSKDLKNHIAHVHSDQQVTETFLQVPSEVPDKRFQCPDCDYSTTTSTHLKLHIRRHHTGEKPYVCEICGNSFLTSYDLKKHSYLHTGEKPYKCPLCPKTFRVSSKLTKHKRVHSGERPFKCAICGKGFTQEYNLSVHKRTHAKEQKASLPVEW